MPISAQEWTGGRRCTYSISTSTYPYSGNDLYLTDKSGGYDLENVNGPVYCTSAYSCTRHPNYNNWITYQDYSTYSMPMGYSYYYMWIQKAKFTGTGYVKKVEFDWSATSSYARDMYRASASKTQYKTEVILKAKDSTTGTSLSDAAWWTSTEYDAGTIDDTYSAYSAYGSSTSNNGICGADCTWYGGVGAVGPGQTKSIEPCGVSGVCDGTDKDNGETDLPFYGYINGKASTDRTGKQQSISFYFDFAHYMNFMFSFKKAMNLKITVVGLVNTEGVTGVCDPCVAGKYDSGGVCVNCLSGTYKAAAGNEACFECPTGKSSTTVSSPVLACTDCETGKVASAQGQSSCDVCGTGLFQDQTAQVTCDLCPVGKFVFGTSANNHKVCTQCTLGKFQANQGQESCTICASGYVAASLGSSTCSLCASGKFTGDGDSEINQANCKDCKTGTFQDQEGQTGCIICPEGKYVAVTAQSACLLCPAGTSLPDGDNQQGQIGAKHDQSSDCIVCETGQIASAEGSATCVACPNLSTNGARTQCMGEAQVCDPGQYRDTNCMNCVAGKYSTTMTATM